ncbi:hypothetical protein [Fimbriiglobus ruber]|uniref:hypothetical protein n=1 Tax=Fimbriiglobus ruber TaxID=1908690 RepID=UPI00117A0412|nr:hypothetical protein [Fimbriiglobus ruber]
MCRTYRVEQELAYCQTLLGLVLDHFGRTLSPDDRNSPLGRVLVVDKPAETERVVTEVTRHLATRHSDLALRLLREETGLAWDDLYTLVGDWAKLDTERKKRWVRFARLAKAARDASRGPA